MKLHIAKAKQKRPQIRVGILCKSLGVNKSTYYRSSNKIAERDRKDLEVIKKYFDLSKQRDGIRQLAMVITRSEGLIINHKKIARIKRLYGLKTKIRVKNKYRHFSKKKHEHESCPNLLDRNFKGLQADQVYSTDVTTLRYYGRKAYLAAVKDLETKEIVGRSVSHRNNIKLTNSAMKMALYKLSPTKRGNLMVHSDQGFNFTHMTFRHLLETNGVTQSMSRRGNCLDNAPIESFFGLIKDHLDLQGCRTLEEVEKVVTRTIDYYNKERPQVGLKKMPPTEYRRHHY